MLLAIGRVRTWAQSTAAGPVGASSAARASTDRAHAAGEGLCRGGVGGTREQGAAGRCEGSEARDAEL